MTIATPPLDLPIRLDSSGQEPRLNALKHLALLDSPAEQAFDRLTRLAAKILHAPVSLLSLVDGDRSFFKSSVGLPELWAARREMPLSHSVCRHVVAMNMPLVINDARADPLVSDNQAVAELRIVAYLGIPLVTSEGHAIGTFAVIDIVPREWTPDDVTTLGDLAASAMTEIELRAETDQRLRVEQQLHLLEAVVGNAATAVLITEAGPTDSEEPRIVFVNDAYTRLTGYSSDEVVGTTHQDLKGSETDRTQIDTIRTALASRKPTRLEFLTHRKDGSAFWVESNIVPIADKTHRYSHWVIVQRDISAQKTAENSLRESEERFRVLTEAIPQIVWTARPDGALDYFNQRWFDYSGMTFEQSQGRGWELAVHPDDLEACVDVWAHAVRTGTPYEIKYRLKRAVDGAYRWHLGRALRVRDDEGEIVKWFGTCTDITEHTQGEQWLAAQEISTRIIAKGDSISQFETMRLRKDGSLVDVSVTISAVKNKEGQVVVASNIARDITERERGEAELMRAHEALEQRVVRRTSELTLAKDAAEAANRAKSEFFSRMSHELRTPLNVILGFGQLLELDTLTDSQRESAEQIGKGGRHLLTLVNEVLDIARIEAGGGGVVSLEEVDVGMVIAEVLGLVQPLADHAGVRLLPPQPEIADWAVRADLQRLKQVLLNLLSNAIKYNQPRGSVAVRCTEAPDAKLRISVIDTGPGIVPEKMHRLFAAFDRLEAERNGIEGTGLGLTLSKGLAEAMKGTMGVESTLGKGTIFWIELPRISKTLVSAGDFPTTIVPPEAISLPSGTVLCVEDNPANFRLIERILKLRPRVRLLSAAQGRLGIDLARQHRPDLIFLDLHLPDIQGDEVLQQLQGDAATRDIPVIMLSADATPHQADRLLAAGAKRYMVKPLNVKEFLQILDDTLEKGNP